MNKKKKNYVLSTNLFIFVKNYAEENFDS